MDTDRQQQTKRIVKAIGLGIINLCIGLAVISCADSLLTSILAALPATGSLWGEIIVRFSSLSSMSQVVLATIYGIIITLLFYAVVAVMDAMSLPRQQAKAEPTPAGEGAGRDMLEPRKTILDMWRNNYTYKEISELVTLSPGRVANIVTELRKELGIEQVPYHSKS